MAQAKHLNRCSGVSEEVHTDGVKAPSGSGARVRLVTHAPTAATTEASFPAGEPLDERGRAWTRAAAGRLGRADHLRRAPDLACAETCDALGLRAEVDHDLASWDMGVWSGRSLADVSAAHPQEAIAWLTDADAAPHGGETLTAFLVRTRAWLSARPGGATTAVCGPALVRAAVVVVLDAPPLSFWRIDVAPLAVTTVLGGWRGWRLRSTSRPLRPT